MFGADQLEPSLNIVILRDSHSSGYSLRSAGPLRYLGIIAQIDRTISIATRIRGLRANIRASQKFAGEDFRFAHRSTVITPMIRSRRMSRRPISDVRPSTCFPPLACYLGTKPSQAAKSRVFGNVVKVGENASTAIAVIGPILGMDINRAVVSETDSKRFQQYPYLAKRRVRTRMWAIVIQASADPTDFSQSLASRRHLPSHAKVRSTTQRRGRTSKPLALSVRLTIWRVNAAIFLQCTLSFGPA